MDFKALCKQGFEKGANTMRACKNCKHYVVLSKPHCHMNGYCSAYIVPAEYYDRERHIVRNGAPYSPVGENNSCDQFEEREEK